MWENYSVVSGLDQHADKKFVTAMLLHCIGKEALRIYNGMQFTASEDKNDCVVVLQKFHEHFIGQTKEFFERFKFNQRNQESGETIEQYLAALRNLEKSCGFCECMREKLIMDRLIMGVKDEKSCEKIIFQS